MFLIHWHSGQKWSALINIHYNKKLNTLGNLCLLAIPPWVLNSLFTKFNHMPNIYNTQTVNSDQYSNSNNSGSNNKNISIIVSYTKGLSERFKKTWNRLAFQCILKATTPSKLYTWPPKIKTINVIKPG